MLKKFVYNLLAVAVALWVTVATFALSVVVSNSELFADYPELGVYLVFIAGGALLAWLFVDFEKLKKS